MFNQPCESYGDCGVLSGGQSESSRHFKHHEFSIRSMDTTELCTAPAGTAIGTTKNSAEPPFSVAFGTER